MKNPAPQDAERGFCLGSLERAYAASAVRERE